MKITVHTLVKNEDVWIWYALKSVLPFVEQIIIYDTGSTDKTVEVIKSINSKKIILEKKGSVDRKKLVEFRQEMIDRTKTDWFLILDGDEVWPKNQLALLIEQAKNADKDIIGLISNTRNCLGDVYHYLPESAGKYQIGGFKGNLTIRMLRKTKDMHMGGEYPYEGISTKEGLIQDQNKRLLFSNTWYLHTSYLQRSSVVSTKTSGSLGKTKFWERGLVMDVDELPEVLFEEPEVFIKDPLSKRGLVYELMANVTAPLLLLKRLLK